MYQAENSDGSAVSQQKRALGRASAPATGPAAGGAAHEESAAQHFPEGTGQDAAGAAAAMSHWGEASPGADALHAAEAAAPAPIADGGPPPESAEGSYARTANVETRAAAFTPQPPDFDASQGQPWKALPHGDESQPEARPAALPAGVMAKLKFSAPGDAHEDEADHIADLATGSHHDDADHSQGSCPGCGGAMRAPAGGGEASCTSCGRTASEAASHAAQEKSDAKAEASKAPALSSIPGGDSVIPVPDSGAPLPQNVQERVGPLLGADLSDVRVHSGDSAQRMTEDFGARAFAHGKHIWMGAGESMNDMRLMAHELAHVKQQGATGPMVHRLGIGDIIPDSILGPIKALVSQVTGAGSQIGSQSESAASQAQGEAAAAGAQAEQSVGAEVSQQQAQGSAAAQQAEQGGQQAQTLAAQAQQSGTTEASKLEGGVALGEYASDPARPEVEPAPQVQLPAPQAGGGSSTGTAAGQSAAQTAVQGAQGGGGGGWNCDIASILSQVSSIGRSVLQSMTQAVKNILPPELLSWASQKASQIRAAIDNVKNRVNAARDAVTKYIEDKLKPIKEKIQQLEEMVAKKIEEVKAAITKKVTELLEQARQKWEALKSRVTTTVNGIIEKVKGSVDGIVKRAKELAGRFWNMLPGFIKDALAGAATALAAPIALAYKAAEKLGQFVSEKATELGKKLQGAADRATQWVAERYKSVKSVMTQAGQWIGKGVQFVKSKATELGQKVYAKVDSLTGGRLSKLQAAVSKKAAELKGEACAVAGDIAGPCADKLLPPPQGGDGSKSFATFATKGELSVIVEGIPVKVSAGASVQINRSADKYNAVLSGEGFLGLGVKLAGGAGSNGGSVSVEGTLPNKALGMMALGSGGGMPAIPIPFGGSSGTQPSGQGAQPAGQGAQPTGQGAQPTGQGAQPTQPQATQGQQPAQQGQQGQQGQQPGAGGGEFSASAEVGKKVAVSMTYTFDAAGTKKNSCDGLGGLAAFMASQGAAGMLPAPFNSIAGAVGTSMFADKLTSAKITYADSGQVAASLSGGPGSVGGAIKGEQGVSLEASVKENKVQDPNGPPGSTHVERERILTATLYQNGSGEVSASLAPSSIPIAQLGGSLAGSTEASLTYSISKDKLNAALKQALTATVTLGAFPGVLGSLPEPARGMIQSKLGGIQANQGSVSLEIARNMTDLASLGTALDAELEKGSGATAAGVWNAIKAYLNNKDAVNTTLTVKATITETILGIKGSITQDEVNAGGEINVSRGQEIVLYTGKL